MKYCIGFFLGFLLTLTATAQDKCACCTEHHMQFDFWLGDWNVYDTLGKQIGQNTIEKLEDGCILKESWHGGKGSTGSSFNYFNKKDSTWNQVWMSNLGNHLTLKGKLEGKNKMVLKSYPGENKNRDIISWTLNEDGSVTQLWQRVDGNSGSRKIIFKGIYRKK